MAVGWELLRVGYVGAFSLTALACFGAILRARDRLADRDTRWGLSTLLATSGLWAAFHVGRLVAPLPTLKLTFYLLGLTTGLATVGAWLYFCSAYTGKPYHRQPRYRWLALGVYTAIIAVKLTNPLHGLYFSTTTAQTPFTHLVIQLGVLHWIVTGLAYALSAIGFYMLFDLFQESNYATTRLSVIVGLAGLPVVFDLIGYLSPGVIITLNYEPIGVALFALGVLYVVDGSFLAVRKFGREQLLDELDEGIILLDADGIIRDVNDAARRLFPALTEGIGQRIGEVVPRIETELPVENSRVVTFDESEPSRYYLLSAPELTVGQTTIGRAIVFTDVTEVERHRRMVERQREQLDAFAEAITHELRNAVNIVQGHLELVGNRMDPDSDASVTESITTVAETADRMTGIVDDLATMARFGQAVEDPTHVEVATIARDAWEAVATAESQLTIDAGERIEADPARLERVFENVFAFAISNGATAVELTQGEGELIITDDGQPLGEADIEGAFMYGQAVPDAESGMLLPVVRTLAEAHGWSVEIDTEYEEGVRLRISH